MTQLQRTVLDRELNQVLEDISKLYSMTDQGLNDAILALQQQDSALARAVTMADEGVNALRFQIESECLRILATQQPRAGDLRLTVAATHIANELERIGDHAAGIATIVERMDLEEPLANLHNIPKMEKHARNMMQQAVQAFLDHDKDAAEGITKREIKLDRHYNELLKTVLLEMQDITYIERANYLLWVGRHLERIGDRATNIAERVIFMVTGQFVEIA